MQIWREALYDGEGFCDGDARHYNGGWLAATITQAGGWKSTRMPLQYAEKINAARSGMAKAAAISGRDELIPENG